MSARASGAKRPLRARSESMVAATSQGAAPAAAQPKGTIASWIGSATPWVICTVSWAPAGADTSSQDRIPARPKARRVFI